MKKKLLLIFCFTLISNLAYAWPGGWYNENLYLPGFEQLPSSCSGNQIIAYTTASSGQKIYMCENGTFIQQGHGGGGGSSSHLASILMETGSYMLAEDGGTILLQ